MGSAARSLPTWLVTACGWVAFLLPLGVALSQLRGVPRWDEDVAVVRALGFSSGFDGVFSGVLGSLFSALPLGQRTLRAALVSAFGVAAGSWLLFQIALGQVRLWRAAGPVGRVDVGGVDLALCIAAALLPTLGPSWQLAATSVGGPALGAVLVLAALYVGFKLDGSVKSWALLGVLFGGSLLEDKQAAFALGVVLTASTMMAGRPPGLPALGVALGCATVTASVLALPGLTSNAAGDGQLLGVPAAASLAETARGAVFQEIGIYLCALAALGAVLGLARTRHWVFTVPWLALVVLASVVEAPVLRLCAVAAFGQLAMIGTRPALGWLAGLRVPFATTALRLLFVLHLCVLLIVSEDSRDVLADRSTSAARRWTEQAFERLPAGALVLADSPEIAWRLWASRVTEGTRPDVTLVPSRLLGHGRLASELIRTEPKLDGLIRDYAVSGVASEFSLSQLADHRPLKVELNPDWHRRLLSHLVPEGLWLDVAPHAVGRTDRTEGVLSVRRAVSRVLADARRPEGEDPATLERLYRDVYQHALLGVTLGDPALSRHLLTQLRRIHPEDSAQVKQLRDRQAANPRGFATAGLVQKGQL